MKNIIKILFLLLLYPYISYSQDNDNIFRKSSESMYDFQAIIPVEKIYVHQDRTKYTAGETIWFKVYQSFSEGIDMGSKVVYVDLIDGTNTIVTKSKWKLEDGTASGHIALPDTLVTGKYLLTAYTKWMQNFDTDYFFTREITVFSNNTLEPEDSNNDIENLSEVITEFFPEGGNLIEGIPSRVAFKITDRYGKGIDGKGKIVDKDGTVIREFFATNKGMGLFNIIPEKGKTYFAQPAGNENLIPLPEVYPSGVVMELKYSDDNLRITLRHNLKRINTKPYNMSIHQNGIDYLNATVNLNNEIIVLDIPAQKLPEGVFTITIFDNNLLAVCERLAFVNYPELFPVDIEADKESYAKRSKVNLKVMAPLSNGNYSLAVVKSSLDQSRDDNYFSDFFLKSELIGRIEDPASYFEEEDLDKMNLLLMTHGWRRYHWENLISGKYTELIFPIEENITFGGKAQLNEKRQKPKNVELTAMLNNDSIIFFSTSLSKEGNFLFTGFDIIDTASIIISATDKRYVVDLSLLPHPNPLPDYNPLPYREIYYEYYDSIYVDLFGKMPVAPKEGIDKVIHELPEVNVVRVIKKRDPRSIHEPAHNISTIKADKKFSYSMPDGGGGTLGALAVLQYHRPNWRNLLQRKSLLYQNNGPDEKLFILDGVYVSENNLRQISPLIIDRVEILSGASSMLYGGRLVLFYTRDPKDMVYLTPSKTVSQKIEGYTRTKEYYSPNYDIKSDFFTSDHRNTLHWEPNIVLNEDGEAEVSFFTSDDTDEYLIHCEGRSVEGAIGVSTLLINTNVTDP